MSYQRLIRNRLFRFGGGDPETAHERTVAALSKLGSAKSICALLQRYYSVSVPRTVFGVDFPNPVGLAAGMDKNGIALSAWPALGFGFIEAGTVTRYAQPGNDRPRLFRLPASEAVINRMGFNNHGAQALATRLARLGTLPVPLGISLGKSKVTPLDKAVTDYVGSLRILHRFGDYFAVNVSSPNTPGLRGLQDKKALAELLSGLTTENRTIAEKYRSKVKPLLVKIAPDLTDTAIIELLEVCAEHRISGVIATNTTLGRAGLAASDQALADQTGGLSGRPLTVRAREVVALVHRETNGQLPIIGVGGISSPDDALRMLDAGASLLQLYTGLIYQGPSLIRRINRAVVNN